MEMDHVKQFSSNPALRYDIENLQVLCVECHRWKTQQERLDPLDKRKKKVDKLNFRP